MTNISPILIKIVDFKNLAWATSFATRASRKFIYRASGRKSYCHTLLMAIFTESLTTCVMNVAVNGMFTGIVLVLMVCLKSLSMLVYNLCHC